MQVIRRSGVDSRIERFLSEQQQYRLDPIRYEAQNVVIIIRQVRIISSESVPEVQSMQNYLGASATFERSFINLSVKVQLLLMFMI